MLNHQSFLAGLTFALVTAQLTLATPANSSSVQQCAANMNGILPSFTPSDFHFSGNIRRYYIAAEQETWDYIPSGWDNWLGVPLDVSPRANQAGYTKSAGSYGTSWEKALYRGYTDPSFSERTEQAATQGINGPTMRAEVGDLIEILVINKLSRNYVSMHSMGLSYNKDNEGSLYPNSTSPGSESTPAVGSAIPPGGCFLYKWVVPEASAPTQSDIVKFWAYHSYVSTPNDLNSGLVGPVIVYPRGKMNETIASHREFVLLYQNFDETMSFLAMENAQKWGGKNATSSSSSSPMPALNMGYGNYSIWHPQITNMPTTMLSSTQAPTFHSLNGFSYANNKVFEMCLNDPVIWYVYAFGMASHVFHLHGNNFVYNGQYIASKSLNDGNMFALQMNASGPGQWELICHVNNHLADGMVDNYRVYPAGSCPLPKLSGM